MIFVDTNILVRAVLEDDLAQATQAMTLLKKAVETIKLFLSSYAIFELACLTVRGLSRHKISEAIFDLIDSPGLNVGQGEVVLYLVEKYKKK